MISARESRCEFQFTGGSPFNLYVTKSCFRSCMHSVYDSSTLKYALDRNTASVSQLQSSGVAKNGCIAEFTLWRGGGLHDTGGPQYRLQKGSSQWWKPQNRAPNLWNPTYREIQQRSPNRKALYPKSPSNLETLTP